LVYYTAEEVDGMFGNTRQEIMKVVLNLEAEYRESMKTHREEVGTGIRVAEENIFERVWAKLEKVTDDIEAILQSKQREKSDLQNMNSKLVAGIEHLSKQVLEVNESIESICTITLCLVESQCMQIRAEEQDDSDKMSISLMGSKGHDAHAAP
jgi:molecular chaperone GrpE (heat shock protein)